MVDGGGVIGLVKRLCAKLRGDCAVRVRTDAYAHPEDSKHTEWSIGLPSSVVKEVMLRRSTGKLSK